jgi:aspartate/methionine/tyrosine aminotransferase
MKIEPFKLERMQSTWENTVEYNLSESGVHPYTLEELLTPEEREAVLRVRLGYSQTDGTPGLREEIARLYPGIGPDQIQVTAGSSEANFLLMWSHIEPGDEVLFEIPNYMQMWGLLRAFGARVKPFRLREKPGWQPDTDEIGKLVTDKTKLIILTNPHNPTGAVLSPESMAAIVAHASKAGAWILADEVYQGAELAGGRTPSFFGMYERVLAVNGMSKAYGLPGVRIGWIAAPGDVIQKIRPYHDYTTISPSAISDKLASIALSPPNRDRILARTRAILNGNWPILEAWLRAQGDIFDFSAPSAGAVVFARYNLDINSTELVEKLVRDISVLLVPGDHFEMDGHLRFGYGSREPYLRSALGLVGKALKDLKYK